MNDIVLNTDNLVWDKGIITRITHQNQENIIQIVREDLTYFIGTIDRNNWVIMNDVTDIPEDFEPQNYYLIDNEWIKRIIPEYPEE